MGNHNGGAAKDNLIPAIIALVAALLLFWPSLGLAYIEIVETRLFKDHFAALESFASIRADHEAIFEYLLWMLTALITPAAYAYARSATGSGAARAPRTALLVVGIVGLLALVHGFNLAVVGINQDVIVRDYGERPYQLLSDMTALDLKTSLGLLAVMAGLRAQESMGKG